MAESQFAEVMADVEYLIIYDVAVPTFPSSPVAVHVSSTESGCVPIDAPKSVTAAGGVPSEGPELIVTE
jgi:hypothetical protein